MPLAKRTQNIRVDKNIRGATRSGMHTRRRPRNRAVKVVDLPTTALSQRRTDGRPRHFLG